MAVTVNFYNAFKAELAKGSHNFTSGTYKLALLTSSYTPDYDAHDNYDDLTNEVANGNGYTTGGATVSGLAVTQDNTDNEGVVDASDTSIASTSITARYGVLYLSTGNSATSKLVCLFDFETNQTTNNGTFGLTWNAEGIININ